MSRLTLTIALASSLLAASAVFPPALAASTPTRSHAPQSVPAPGDDRDEWSDDEWLVNDDDEWEDDDHEDDDDDEWEEDDEHDEHDDDDDEWDEDEDEDDWEVPEDIPHSAARHSSGFANPSRQSQSLGALDREAQWELTESAWWAVVEYAEIMDEDDGELAAERRAIETRLNEIERRVDVAGISVWRAVARRRARRRRACGQPTLRRCCRIALG